MFGRLCGYPAMKQKAGLNQGFSNVFVLRSI